MLQSLVCFSNSRKWISTVAHSIPDILLGSGNSCSKSVAEMLEYSPKLLHERADSKLHSPIFLHSYSVNYSKLSMTPYGLIILIYYFGSYTLAEDLPQLGLHATLMSYCCDRITVPGLATCINHGQTF